MEAIENGNSNAEEVKDDETKLQAGDPAPESDPPAGSSSNETETDHPEGGPDRKSAPKSDPPAGSSSSSNSTTKTARKVINPHLERIYKEPWNPYRILELDDSPKTEEVAETVRALLKVAHPDKYTEPEGLSEEEKKDPEKNPIKKANIATEKLNWARSELTPPKTVGEDGEEKDDATWAPMAANSYPDKIEEDQSDDEDPESEYESEKGQEIWAGYKEIYQRVTPQVIKILKGLADEAHMNAVEDANKHLMAKDKDRGYRDLGKHIIEHQKMADNARQFDAMINQYKESSLSEKRVNIGAAVARYNETIRKLVDQRRYPSEWVIQFYLTESGQVDPIDEGGAPPEVKKEENDVPMTNGGQTAGGPPGEPANETPKPNTGETGSRKKIKNDRKIIAGTRYQRYNKLHRKVEDYDAKFIVEPRPGARICELLSLEEVDREFGRGTGEAYLAWSSMKDFRVTDHQYSLKDRPDFNGFSRIAYHPTRTPPKNRTELWGEFEGTSDWLKRSACHRCFGKSPSDKAIDAIKAEEQQSTGAQGSSTVTGSTPTTDVNGLLRHILTADGAAKRTDASPKKQDQHVTNEVMRGLLQLLQQNMTI